MGDGDPGHRQGCWRLIVQVAYIYERCVLDLHVDLPRPNEWLPCLC